MSTHGGVAAAGTAVSRLRRNAIKTELLFVGAGPFHMAPSWPTPATPKGRRPSCVLQPVRPSGPRESLCLERWVSDELGMKSVLSLHPHNGDMSLEETQDRSAPRPVPWGVAGGKGYGLQHCLFSCMFPLRVTVEELECAVGGCEAIRTLARRGRACKMAQPGWQAAWWFLKG